MDRLAKRIAKTRALAAILGATLVTVPASAEELTVASGEVLVAANGACSLREAIENADQDTQVSNADCPSGSGADVIHLAGSSTYTLPNFVDTTRGQNGLPSISSEITIEANGSTIERAAGLACVLNGVATASEFRIFHVQNNGDLQLNDAVVQNGCADGGGGGDDGGGIRVDDGEVGLLGTTVRDNRAEDKSGGVDVSGSGAAGIFESTLAGNHAQGGGGGLGVGRSASAEFIGSTASGNSADGDGGGGIGNRGAIVVLNSTISGNSTTGIGGGGIGSTGDVTISFSTIWGNSSSSGLGGGIGSSSGRVEISRSIVGGSLAGANCTLLAAIATIGTNIDTDGSCQGFQESSESALSLGPLANNGGATQTHRPAEDSEAVDRTTACQDFGGGPVNFDQRGVGRPHTRFCDIGAVELAPDVMAPAMGLLGYAVLAFALLGLGLIRKP